MAMLPFDHVRIWSTLQSTFGLFVALSAVFSGNRRSPQPQAPNCSDEPVDVVMGVV
jgi:hypothetical protein